MRTTITNALTSFTHLFFPHNCIGCGSDALQHDAVICPKCHHSLPLTGFMPQPGNPVEKIFYGRVTIQQAGSLLYFTKNSIVQHLVFALKYRGNKEAGYYLGRLLGMEIQASARFNEVDAIIPLPLNKKKEKKRGYNQAALIAEGIQQVWNRPVINNAALRKYFTETQTHKGRTARWQNMQHVFAPGDIEGLQNKHLLLVDDVVTTGASLEACANALQVIAGVKISIATVAYTIL
jgi:ComF family protein